MPETGGGLDFPERPQNNLTSRIKMSSQYWITGSKCGIYVLRYIVKAKAQSYNAIKSIMTELELVGLSNFERMSQTFLSIPSVENECRKSLTIYIPLTGLLALVIVSKVPSASVPTSETECPFSFLGREHYVSEAGNGQMAKWPLREEGSSICRSHAFS
ncbi:predicted protein [Coccidioides posadasii str. Silveira]|uniref:Predicted protein n=1 Tax=Coccidioides posadasii (strain RMSCC 757 / Silveira) TaxID=443226 RepID=E9CSU0_COCPS|nr:predicted protein [Coccidioides posadasii str. Silveira]